MHRFWIKTCNLILVVALLFGYQAVVQSRAQKETIAELEYELQQKTVSGQPEEADGADSPYADGTYTGEAQGYGGTVAVELTVENGKITDLTITSAEKRIRRIWMLPVPSLIRFWNSSPLMWTR